MTKQEVIMQGLRRLYIEHPIEESVGETKDHWVHSGLTNKAIDAILSYLHSLGVVIKVEGELPKYWFDRGVDGYTEQHYIPSGLQEALKEAGYVAVEPLIGESNGD